MDDYVRLPISLGVADPNRCRADGRRRSIRALTPSTNLCISSQCGIVDVVVSLEMWRCKCIG
jgi:hypothetical protein